MKNNWFRPAFVAKVLLGYFVIMLILVGTINIYRFNYEKSTVLGLKSVKKVPKKLKAKLKRVKRNLTPTPTHPISPTALPSITINNQPPQTGYQRQYVQSDVGIFLVDIVGADLNSTRVVIDTASDGNCGDNCPVMTLSDYVGRSGAFAAINGPYFCPSSYPNCAGKTNSFDTLLMNKNKVYFNSDNNIYSNVPAVIFSGNSARWVSRSLEWGRDTNVDSVIAGQPLLLAENNIIFGGDDDPKKGSRGSRSFIATKGSAVYIGVVKKATVAEVAHVLKVMGLNYALNLDSGGSVALWHEGRYIAGPGRQIPFGILFVKK